MTLLKLNKHHVSGWFCERWAKAWRVGFEAVRGKLLIPAKTCR